ncbi:hypothetical protein ACFSUS_02305 [Spirosoma soli]|uniref:Uncharacterized protein n=1 Tax=Spirosoma soli TaxID=1770529 RepID=A0ABW5LYQ0_9BACT
MISLDLTHQMRIVKQLPFVAEVGTLDDERLIVITLVNKLARYLPVSRAVLSISATDFSLEAVKASYQRNVVDYLTSTLKLAEELQETA